MTSYEGPNTICPHCNWSHPPEVGMGPFHCENCNLDMAQPTQQPEPFPPGPNDDVLDDPEFIMFDEHQAFRILKRAGRLSECRIGETTTPPWMRRGS